jgi:hypothetical protein
VSVRDISCPVELAMEPSVVESVELAVESIMMPIQPVVSIVESGTASYGVDCHADSGW